MKKFFSKLRNILCIFAALAGVLFISSAAVAQSLPDLTVTNATYTPANPNTSDEIILSITVRNQGKAIAENIFVSIFVDNEEFDYYFIPDLEPGESSTDEIELWDLTAGRRTIRVEIDPDNEISESNKKNNIHTFYMTVAQGPQPDLVITSATIEPPNPSATDQIILNITVKNQGAAPSDETELDVYVDGDLFDTCYIFDLDVGETQTEDVNLWYLPAGNHAIWIAVDPDNIVKESNENNNSYNLAMNVNFGFFNTKISGAIKDLETQKPVNGIIVQLDGGAFQTYTNAKGEFSIYGAAPGMHKLQVWGFAYNFQQFDIYVFDDKDTAIAEIAMTKLDGTVVGASWTARQVSLLQQPQRNSMAAAFGAPSPMNKVISCSLASPPAPTPYKLGDTPITFRNNLSTSKKPVQLTSEAAASPSSPTPSAVKSLTPAQDAPL